MMKKFLMLLLVSSFLLLNSGCALLRVAAGAAVAYGLSKAFD